MDKNSIQNEAMQTKTNLNEVTQHPVPMKNKKLISSIVGSQPKKRKREQKKLVIVPAKNIAMQQQMLALPRISPRSSSRPRLKKHMSRHSQL